MTDVKKDADTSTKEPADGGTKLFLGKYKTMEEAEAGYKELERGFHEKSGEAARYRESLDQLLTEPKGDDKKTDQGGDNEPVVVFGNEPEETFAQRFMENPRKYLKAVKAEAKRESVAESAAHNELYLATREYIGEFLSSNQDLKVNGRLFSLHLSNTNPREKLGKRLDDAAKATRDEIARIREDVKKAKDFQKGQKDKAGSVEGDDAKDADNQGPKKDAEPDDSFDSYMKDRQAQHAKYTGGIV